MKKDEARHILEEAGYYTKNLWCIDDVKDIFDCSDDEAYEVLHKALNNDATMQQIWLAIRILGDDMNLKRKKYGNNNTV